MNAGENRIITQRYGVKLKKCLDFPCFVKHRVVTWIVCVVSVGISEITLQVCELFVYLLSHLGFVNTYFLSS